MNHPIHEDYRHSGLSDRKIESYPKRLLSYRKRLQEIVKADTYEEPESCLNVPFDKKSIKHTKEVIKSLRGKSLKYVVVIGIGGSYLGTKAIYDAIKLDEKQNVELLFLDTISAINLIEIKDKLVSCRSQNSFAIVSVSKSGGTTETVVNTETLLAELIDKFPKVHERLVVITNENSAYWNAAQKMNVATLPIPEVVGGRFSVFTSVGLLPLALAGINIDELVEGAKLATQVNLLGETTSDSALTRAICAHHHYKKGRTVLNTFLFDPQLASFGTWLRQLIAESLGKEGKGIIPITSIGTTDLHSLMQLYMDGPDVIQTRIVSIRSRNVDLTSPDQPFFGELVEDADNLSLNALMRTIVEGVKETYGMNGRPMILLDFSGMDATSLAFVMQSHMLEVMYIAKLMNVNAFNQPGVEGYKEVVRKRLRTSRQ